MTDEAKLAFGVDPKAFKEEAEKEGSEDLNKAPEEAPKKEKEKEAEGEKAEEKEKEKPEASSEDIESKEPESPEAPKKAEDTQSAYDELSDRYMRLAADFKNYKRRAEEERLAVFAMAGEEMTLDLLSVVDSFELALEGESAPEEGAFVEGMKLILKQLKGVLEKNGAEEIKADAEFDPLFHHAVMAEESDAESGMITRVFQKGYMMNGKVIRPAMVAVSK